MTNGMRHLIGGIIGLVAIPLVLYLMSRAIKSIDEATANADPIHLRWAGLWLVASGLVVGIIAGWRRLSPLAALISGLALAAVGGLWLFMPLEFEPVRDSLPLAELINARAMPVSLGLGVVLIVSAIIGGRRRSPVTES
jgi:hypothetical protein